MPTPKIDLPVNLGSVPSMLVKWAATLVNSVDTQGIGTLPGFRCPATKKFLMHLPWRKWPSAKRPHSNPPDLLLLFEPICAQKREFCRGNKTTNNARSRGTRMFVRTCQFPGSESRKRELLSKYEIASGKPALKAHRQGCKHKKCTNCTWGN